MSRLNKAHYDLFLTLQFGFKSSRCTDVEKKKIILAAIRQKEAKRIIFKALPSYPEGLIRGSLWNFNHRMILVVAAVQQYNKNSCTEKEHKKYDERIKVRP